MVVMAALLLLLPLAAAGATAEDSPGPVIPAPSTTCGGADVVVGWCLQDAPMGPKQPPPKNFTDAECCARCTPTMTLAQETM